MIKFHEHGNRCRLTTAEGSSWNFSVTKMPDRVLEWLWMDYWKELELLLQGILLVVVVQAAGPA